MEGNSSTGAVVLAEYLRVHGLLSEIRGSTTTPSLRTMVDTMIQQLDKYQSEAVAAEVIVLATILKPRCRLRFFELHYPEEVSRAKQCIEDVFNKTLDDWPATPPSTPGPTPLPLGGVYDQFDVFTSSSTFQTPDSIRAAEVDQYLQGSHPIAPGQTELSWWMVSLSCS